MTLPCMNCKSPVPQDQGNFFAEVFLCGQCYASAEHFYQRLEKELKQLKLVAKEAMRVALVTGKFSFSEPRGEEPSKMAVLQEIIKMTETRS